MRRISRALVIDVWFLFILSNYIARHAYLFLVCYKLDLCSVRFAVGVDEVHIHFIPQWIEIFYFAVRFGYYQAELTCRFIAYVVYHFSGQQKNIRITKVITESKTKLSYNMAKWYILLISFLLLFRVILLFFKAAVFI